VDHNFVNWPEKKKIDEKISLKKFFFKFKERGKEKLISIQIKKITQRNLKAIFSLSDKLSFFKSREKRYLIKLLGVLIFILFCKSNFFFKFKNIEDHITNKGFLNFSPFLQINYQISCLMQN